MSLEEQNASLLKYNERLTGETTRRKNANRVLSAKVAELTGELAVMKASVSASQSPEPQAAPAKPRLQGQADDRDTEITELKAQLRTQKHLAAFRTAVTTEGVSPARVDALWKLSDHDSSGEEIDTTKITETIEKLRMELPEVFKSAPAATGTSPANPNPGPGVKRGTTPKAGVTPDSFVVTKENMQSHTWMFANKSKMNEARKAGLLVFE